ncbi:peptidoglycan-binding protein [Hyalangium versicolor]|uniref:peptidoglycan-binding protein n=1 Tax=Hyalangium versicolor TaxID=2861190 RepID=UPI001CCF03C9|nr:peptidoglycan-binding protein [Hyalangium versicolor]
MTAQFTGTTDAKSTFKVEPPSVLRLKLMLNGEVLKNEPCEVSFDGAAAVKKSADGSGFLQVPIPRGAKMAHVVLLQHKPVEHTLRLGVLSPVDSVTGQKLRLRQLGYYSGKLGQLGSEDADLKAALINFQRTHKLKESGTLDGPTQDALKKAYGC